MGSLASFEIREDRSFRRWVIVSTLAHAVLLGVVGLSPRPSGRATTLPAVVQVNLLAAAPSRPQAAPKPAPAPPPEAKPEPEPAPPPPPPPPAPKKVLLPTEPTRKAEPEKPKPVAKPKPKPKPRPEPPKRQESYQDVLASLRQEAGEKAPQPVEVADAAPTSDAQALPGGVGIPISAEEAAWRRRVRIHVHRAWVLGKGFRMQPLETEVRVKLGPGGHVLDLRVTRKSGNPWYDESVERAINKASPLPRPPEAGEWIFVFRPEDLFG